MSRPKHKRAAVNPVHTFSPVFFDSGRVVHLMNPRTGDTFCGLAGGRPLWMATVTLDVPNGCRRCGWLATPSE